MLIHVSINRATYYVGLLHKVMSSPLRIAGSPHPKWQANLFRNKLKPPPLVTLGKLP